MKLYALTVTLTLVTFAVASAIPKPDEEHKNRVYERELSDQKHVDDEEQHNPEYDHEAFLGKDEAQTFDDLSPEESKKRLAVIYDKIDKDSDGRVSDEELKNWIHYVQNKYILDDANRQWKDFVKEGEGDDAHITWAEYKTRTYGYLQDMAEFSGDPEDEADSYKSMMQRDERRWKRADENGDGNLSKKEYIDFLHPEEAERMRDIVVQETMEDIDKDKDGYITEEEYIGDFYPDAEDRDHEEPDWVASERQAFREEHDQDKDGKLDPKELMNWIIPDDYDHSAQESQHLLTEADIDKDGFLTKEEVVNKYDLFVGSQATDFGEALTRHDEF